MSRVDPRRLASKVVDRKTTLLLQAARSEVKPVRRTRNQDLEHGDQDGDDTDGEYDPEKHLEATEEPGVDALAGRFGASIVGTVVRARRRATIAGSGAKSRGRSKRKREETGAAGMNPGANDSSVSVGMDSIRARELHAQWKAEKKDANTSRAQVIPVSEEGREAAIDGLPPGASKVGHSANGYANGNVDKKKRDERDEVDDRLCSSPEPLTLLPPSASAPARVTSADRLTASPAMTGPGTPGSISSSPSVHFQIDAHPSRLRERENRPDARQHSSSADLQSIANNVDDGPGSPAFGFGLMRVQSPERSKSESKERRHGEQD